MLRRATRNQIELLGYLGGDAELFALEERGTRVTRFRLATDRVWRDRNGERQKATEWHQCVVWDQGPRKLAEQAATLRRGDYVLLAGRLEYHTWESDAGPRVAAEIRVDSLIALDRADEDAARPSPAAIGAQRAATDSEAEQDRDQDDDLPW